MPGDRIVFTKSVAAEDWSQQFRRRRRERLGAEPGLIPSMPLDGTKGTANKFGALQRRRARLPLAHAIAAGGDADSWSARPPLALRLSR